MIGAWGGHVTAARAAPRDVRVRQVPLAAIMVALTTLTLWSLGQAIVRVPAATPSASAPAPAAVSRFSVAVPADGASISVSAPVSAPHAAERI